MVIDSSALIAIVRDESEGLSFQRLVETASRRLVSSPTVLEASIVMLSRFGTAGLADLSDFIGAAGIEIIAFDPQQVDLALDASRNFGKGRHPAGLNFGDCISYALSKATGEPLLFKGNDFARTDATPAAVAPLAT